MNIFLFLVKILYKKILFSYLYCVFDIISLYLQE